MTFHRYKTTKETTLILSPSILFPIVAAFWIFVIWVLWTVAKSLTGINESFKDIARSLRDRNLS